MPVRFGRSCSPSARFDGIIDCLVDSAEVVDRLPDLPKATDCRPNVPEAEDFLKKLIDK